MEFVQAGMMLMNGIIIAGVGFEACREFCPMDMSDLQHAIITVSSVALAVIAVVEAILWMVEQFEEPQGFNRGYIEYLVGQNGQERKFDT